MRFAITACLIAPLILSAQFGWLGRNDHFVPTATVAGIGVGRAELSDIELARRAEQMIDSQTFAILRDPQALSGAERITGPKLTRIFEDASRRSGLPASFIAAIAYLESWGRPDVQSSAGPKGIMQIAHATAKSMGLQINYATKYRQVTEKVQQRKKGSKKSTPVTRTRKIPYTVLVRDERLMPEKAVPAAAMYLARLEQRYGGRDWAVWAYHCGEGCIAEVRGIADRARLKEPVTVSRVFFGANPARHVELHRVIQKHMDRDYSPTYFFRIKRAEELLAVYKDDPSQFKKMFNEYRFRINPDQRAPHRLTVWLKPDDLAYRTCEDMRREAGSSLVKALDDPKYFGFSLAAAIGQDDPKNREYYLQASQAAIGTVAYIAWETRRLHEAMKPKNEKFVPLEVASLVRPLDREERTLDPKTELPSHCSGQVFDLNVAALPSGERDALEFVLSDLGFSGHLGFIRESASATFHIGAAPTARDFFARVYREASTAREHAANVNGPTAGAENEF
ncbi:MAG: transglycosylase SLT domain-containing protein [Bryobacteraceae bacterium]|nr:transglycosylase SLT domain-containing protein [Bryobacteraceae bacterium]